MQKTMLQQKTACCDRAYWHDAARQLRDVRMLVFAALIIALRVAVKYFKLPLASGLSLSFDCYVNSLGSLVYGPVVALLVGAVSDTVGCILIPSGAYFFPFIFVEMSSSFLFALFFWRQKITVRRTLLAKFTVNFVCNIIMTSLFVKWNYYLYYGVEKAEAYNAINLVRIGKNLVLFPLEAFLIVLVLGTASKPLIRAGLVPTSSFSLDTAKKKAVIAEVSGVALLSVGLVLFYIFFLRDFIAQHNIKLL